MTHNPENYHEFDVVMGGRKVPNVKVNLANDSYVNPEQLGSGGVRRYVANRCVRENIELDVEGKKVYPFNLV